MRNFYRQLGTIMGVIIAAVALYYQVIYTPKTILDIQTLNSVLLTKSLNVDGLTSRYLYNDSVEVENLWQTTFLIRNVGDKTIYSKGFEGQSIRDSYLPFEIKGCDKILSININKENNKAYLLDSLRLAISQWRKNEYVEIVVLADGKESPKLMINDRDIVDSQIVYSIYSPDSNANKGKLIDYIPTKTANFLRGFSLVIFLALMLFALFQAIKQYNLLKTRIEKILFVIILSLLTAPLFTPLLWMF